jgi:predicted transcriptional regulator
MAKTVRDVMATDVVSVGFDTPLVEVARLMRDRDIGDVLVNDGTRLRGILTDRDITVRAVAEGFQGGELATIEPDMKLADAERVMKERAVRRLPVVEATSRSGSCRSAICRRSAMPASSWLTSRPRRRTNSERNEP